MCPSEVRGEAGRHTKGGGISVVDGAASRKLESSLSHSPALLPSDFLYRSRRGCVLTGHKHLSSELGSATRGENQAKSCKCRFFFQFKLQFLSMAEEGQVISCHTVETWTEQLQKADDSKKLVVVDFTASWCGPCRIIAPVFAELARKMPNVIFLKVDVDELRTVAEEWAIEAMPTFILLKEGRIVDKVVGAMKDELHLKIANHSTETVAA